MKNEQAGQAVKFLIGSGVKIWPVGWIRMLHTRRTELVWWVATRTGYDAIWLSDGVAGT
jgi:hypothetical protein